MIFYGLYLLHKFPVDFLKALRLHLHPTVAFLVAVPAAYFIGHPVVEFIGEAISETQGSLRKCALKGMVHAGRTEETDGDHSPARRTLLELR